MNVTEKATQMLARQIEVAKRDGSGGTRGIRITVDKNGTPRFILDGNRIGNDKALEHVARALAEESAEPKPRTKAALKKAAGPMNWDRLNMATKEFFFELCEQMVTKTQCADCSVAVRLGHDIPKIAAKNQPRLTNLKKAGLVKSYVGNAATHRMLALTEAGKAIWTSRK